MAVKTSSLIEESVFFEDSQGKPPRVDRENGVVYGVKILGTESRTTSGKIRRRYSRNAMESAAKMYNGMGVNTNHPDRKTPEATRDVQDRFAWIEETELRGDGVYGNVHCLLKHPFTSVFLEAAEANPRLFGFSHNAYGPDKVGNDGVLVVTDLDQINSIDCVQRPATTKGLFESQEEEPEVPQKTLKQFIESMQASNEKKALSLLLEEDPAMSEAPAPEMAAEASGDDQISMAFEAAIVAAFRDKKLDMKGKIGKMKTILKSYESISGEGGEKKKETPAPSSEGEGGDSAKKMESMEAENRQLKEEKVVRSFMESQEVRPTDARVAAMLPLDETARKSLCADFKAADTKAATPAKPRSSSILESQERDVPSKIPEDPKEFAKMVTVPRRY